MMQNLSAEDNTSADHAALPWAFFVLSAILRLLCWNSGFTRNWSFIPAHDTDLEMVDLEVC